VGRESSTRRGERSKGRSRVGERRRARSHAYHLVSTGSLAQVASLKSHGTK
jgi:hypothetical protein